MSDLPEDRSSIDLHSLELTLLVRGQLFTVEPEKDLLSKKDGLFCLHV